MLKMIIVDDKEIERKFFSELLEYSKLGIEVVGTATNGVEGLMLVEKYHPDIVITDIVMPQMDGIAMISKIKVVYPNINIVIVSSYSEFKYAQIAIKYGVMDYMIKPVLSSEVYALLSKIVNKMQEKTAALSGKEESGNTANLFDENIEEIKKLFLQGVLNGKYADEEVIIEKFRIYGLEDLLHQTYSLAEFRVKAEDKLETLITIFSQSSFIQHINVEHTHDSLSVLYYDRSLTEKTLQAEISCICQKLRENSIEFQSGISNIALHIGELSELHNQVVELLDTMAPFSPNAPVFYKELSDFNANSENIDYNSIENELSEILFDEDKEKIEEFCKKIVYKNNTKGVKLKSIAIHIINYCNMLIVSSDKNTSLIQDETDIYEKVLNIHGVENLFRLLKEFLNSVKERVSAKGNLKDQKFAGKIIQAIEELYSEKVTIDDILKGIHYHPVYANATFKKATGLSINQYLIKVRMQKAQELLKTTDIKIFKIAEQVGYWNRSYFTLAFKEYTGMTPKEYRDHNFQEGADE